MTHGRGLPDRATQPQQQTRAVEQVNTVEVHGAKEGLVVRPGEVLVLSFPGYTRTDELEILRRSMMNAGLDGRFILIGGQVDMSKVEATDAVSPVNQRSSRPNFGAERYQHPDPGRTYTRDRLLGSTVEGEVLP
jgi:hypothetical protein